MRLIETTTCLCIEICRNPSFVRFFRPLELRETRVQTVLWEQLLVRAALDDAPLVEDRRS